MAPRRHSFPVPSIQPQNSYHDQGAFSLYNVTSHPDRFPGLIARDRESPLPRHRSPVNNENLPPASGPQIAPSNTNRLAENHEASKQSSANVGRRRATTGLSRVAEDERVTTNSSSRRGLAEAISNSNRETSQNDRLGSTSEAATANARASASIEPPPRVHSPLVFGRMPIRLRTPQSELSRMLTELKAESKAHSGAVVEDWTRKMDKDGTGGDHTTAKMGGS